MAAETAVLVTIATSLASGLLKEVSKKALDAASESSTVAGLKSAIFGGLETDLRYLEKELCKLDSVLSSAQSIDPMHMHYNDNKLLLIWLGGVKEAACFADNLLDEIAYEKIRKQVQKKTSPFAKFSGFPKRIAGKIKKFVSMTDEIYKEAETTLNLAKLAGKASTATYQPPPTSISENLREIRENPDTSIVVGREADEELIVTKLCRPHNHPDLPVVAIVGRSDHKSKLASNNQVGNSSSRLTRKSIFKSQSTWSITCKQQNRSQFNAEIKGYCGEPVQTRMKTKY